MGLRGYRQRRSLFRSIEGRKQNKQIEKKNENNNKNNKNKNKNLKNTKIPDNRLADSETPNLNRDAAMLPS